MFRLSEEKTDDWWEVEALLDNAFGPGRTGLSSYRLREGVDPVHSLCLVARDPLEIVSGAIRYWPIRVGSTPNPSLLLGPVAVHPTRQGEGLGALLIGESLERAQGLGWEHVVLVGDEPYYKRFGFTREAARAIRFPPPTNDNRVLARCLGGANSDDLAGEVMPWSDRDNVTV